MTVTSSNTPPPVLVAIDISKLKHDVFVKHPDGKTNTFKVANNFSDFEKFCAYLASLKSTCRIALEPTADYHRLIAWRLLQCGYDVRLASSIACARTREAIFNSRDKNDVKDTKVIMYLLESGIVQHYHDPLANNLNDIQEIANTYAVIAYRRTQVLHSLKNHYLALYFPEIEKYLISTRALWFTKTFSRFPTPGSISKLSEKKFIAIANPLVGRKQHKKQWLQELYITATHSIGLPVSETSVAAEMFVLMLSEYERLTTIRMNIQEKARSVLSSNPDYELLQSIPGVGPIIALSILAEGGDLRRFKHHKQFLKFCGFDLATHQSGKYKSNSSLSKRGNARLRLVFWQAATIAIRQTENSFRNKYTRYITANTDTADNRRKARVAVAAKLARVAYSIVKSGNPYRPYFESALPGGKIPLIGP